MSEKKWIKVATPLVAIITTEWFSGSYDDVLSPLAISHFGKLNGSIIMGFAALAINFLMIQWYRRTTTDWYGFESAMKVDLEEQSKEGLLSKKIARSRFMKFLILSVKDPFLAFVYYEGRKAHGSKFDSRDWSMFIVSNLIGIVLWMTVLCLVSEYIGTWLLYAISIVGFLTVVKIIYNQKVVTKL